MIELFIFAFSSQPPSPTTVNPSPPIKVMNGLNADSAEFEDTKLWSHSLDSEEWIHLQKSTLNVSQLLEKVEEDVLKSFGEMEKQISGIGRSVFLLLIRPLSMLRRQRQRQTSTLP